MTCLPDMRKQGKGHGWFGDANLPGLCCAEGEETDEQRRQQASSPPPSWEDRAELLPEEQPFGVAWMETGLHAHPLLCSPFSKACLAFNLS